jgi:hypothetical protein
MGVSCWLIAPRKLSFWNVRVKGSLPPQAVSKPLWLQCPTFAIKEMDNLA